MKKTLLFTPGPTPVPKEVFAAMNQEMIHHRSEEFSKILSSARKGLSSLCGNPHETVILTCSGTGAMEATVAALFKPQDEVGVVCGGKFGDRWKHIALAHDLRVKTITVEWGQKVEVQQVLGALSANTKGVLIQGCETSTGVAHPIRELGQALQNKNLLFVVDGITSMGVHDFQMQRDHMDVYVGGSQKALMCPPGLGFVSLSEKASRALCTPKHGYYLNLKKEYENQIENKVAFTPAISLIRGVEEALNMIFEEGVAEVFARHKLMQQMSRAAFRALGFELFNLDTDAAWGLTTVKVPEGLDIKALLKKLKTHYGLWLAGGQDQLEGKIFRLSHMGHCFPEHLKEAFEILELALETSQAKDHLGSKLIQKMIEENP